MARPDDNGLSAVSLPPTGRRSRTFAKDVAARQGAFRETSSTISLAGRSPKDAVGIRHKHLLALGCEQENLFPELRSHGGALDFFRERHIHWWRSTSTGDRPGVESPTRNLTSSQLLCVNFLMPLREHPTVLLAMLNKLDGDVEDIVSIRYPSPTGETVESLVDFEFVGLSEPLEGGRPTRGAHVTSCDAVVLVRTRDLALRIYLMEWKYAEQYIGAKSKAAEDRGRVRLARYRERYEAADGPFNRLISLRDVLYDPIYQIVRLGLLGDKLCREGAFGVEEARVVVVCPEDNIEYRDTVTSPAIKAVAGTGATLEGAVRSLWKDSAGFRVTSPQVLLNSARRVLPAALVKWDAYMIERYGW